MKIHKLVPLWLALNVLLLSACALGSLLPAATVAPEEPHTVDPSDTPEPPAPTETAAPSPTFTSEPETSEMQDPAAACPTAGEGSSQYIDLDNGFCLLYPQEFELNTFADAGYDRVSFLGPMLDPAAMEPVRTYMVIEANGFANDLDSFQYALTWLEWFMPGFEPERETGFIGGQPAVILKGLPFYGPPEQSAFIIANGFKYRLNMAPQVGDVPDLDEYSQRVWEMVTGTIVFFEPQGVRQVLRPQDVCLPESPGFRQYIHQADGYCLLYPEDFTPTDNFPGDFEGGPILEEDTAWGDLRASLTVGTYGYFPDKTVMEVLDPRSEFIDMDTLQEIEIAGYPAVTYRDPRGPWASRQAMISVDGMIYTIVNQPWEPERYPDGITPFNRIWDSVVGSLRFFDPWR